MRLIYCRSQDDTQMLTRYLDEYIVTNDHCDQEYVPGVLSQHLGLMLPSNSDEVTVAEDLEM
jgi:hypothetical protein